MIWMIAVSIAWTAAAIGVGVVLGRAITSRDRERRPVVTGADRAPPE
jgi:hypothetical protein